MPHYIRSQPPGATYFFTARLADRDSTLLTDRIELLRQVTRLARQRYPFEIDAVVILPAAIHTLWTLPRGDADCSIRWRFLKSAFSRAVPTADDHPNVKRVRTDKGIWQRHFWEHRIRSPQDLALHRTLIHTAPVQAGLVDDPLDWAWTSLHRDMAVAHPATYPEPPKPFGALKLKDPAPT
ncbi:transposase [uncultured Roseobacter sp.]|uniref:REP-associated tyrosine transposase n=1 Tax=uncultured Roseobacter sp. TaxID=114847 RepID=UPI00260E56DA|nr:transposase [uncultured Roseobacter sp.]